MNCCYQTFFKHLGSQASLSRGSFEDQTYAKKIQQLMARSTCYSIDCLRNGARGRYQPFIGFIKILQRPLLHTTLEELSIVHPPSVGHQEDYPSAYR